MNKTQTVPIIRFTAPSVSTIQSNQTPKSNILSLFRSGQLSFAETQPNKNIFINNKSNQRLDFKQKKLNVDQLSLFQTQSQYEKSNKNNQRNDNDIKQSKNKKISKQCMIAMQLQQNQQLRINLFKAQKTIQDLQQICKDLQSKMLQVLYNKKQQILTKLTLTTTRNTKQQQITTQRKSKNKLTQNFDKQNIVNPQIINKYSQIAQIWKNCYSDLVQYINSYTKDITFLTQQYKILQQKNKSYKKYTNKSKRNQQNLLKILQQSNNKLQKYQNNMQKLLQDLKQRDIRIQEYQIQNKNIKMKIIQNLQQIQKLKRDNKIQLRDSISYKEVAKSLQQQINDLTNKCQQLYIKISNKQKLQQIMKNNQQALQQRLHHLQLQLTQTRKFNENLMEEYKKLSAKIQQNQEKLSQKYMSFENMQEKKIINYEKLIQTLKKQKQNQNNKMTFLQQQIQQMYKMKSIKDMQIFTGKQNLQKMRQELEKQKEKFNGFLTDLEARMQQKDRQIQYLQQLKAISNQNNQELKIELDQVRADMVLIIQQLKVKQLEIQKYKLTNTPKGLDKKYSNKQILNKSSSWAKISKIQATQSPQNQQNKKDNNGIIWKKIKKQSDSAFFEREGSNQLSQIQAQSIPSFQNRKIKNLKIDIQDSQNLDSHQIEKVKQNTLQFDRVEKQFRSKSKTQKSEESKDSKLDTPKSKFSLHAFQNKIIMEQSAKFLVKLNKTMFK